MRSDENKQKLKETIINTNKRYELLFNITMLLGSIGFLIVGLSSYFKTNLIPILNANEIVFFPQGATMSFYGTLGTIISIYQLLIMTWGVGEGYNEFDKEKGTLTIFRRGFPGKDSEIKITYSLEDIEGIKVKSDTDIINTRQTIFICIKGKPDIPILQIRPPIKISELEEKASQIASFLKVSVKGF